MGTTCFGKTTMMRCLTNQIDHMTMKGERKKEFNPMSDRQNGTSASKNRKKVTAKPNPATYVTPRQSDVNDFFRKRPPKRKASPNEAGSSSTGTPSPTEPKIARHCPLPELSWANRDDVWSSMIKRERKHRIDMAILDRHREITPRMRSVLIDWLIEVSEVYRLHRETLYMAVNYVDRYLSRQSSATRKSELQLIGISALFFAAKLEEIYPPKLAEFAYVTDSACTEVEMREMELMMLKKLQWELSPPTAISWLNLYLQTAQLPLQTDFHLPLYPQETFVQIAQLLDLCLMDIGSLRFVPSVLAAACLYHFSSEDLALECSGFTLQEISPAIRWVTPFAMTIRDQGLASLRSFRKVQPEDAHNIQTHINTIATLEKAQYRQMATSPVKMATTPSKAYGTPITPAEVGTPMSAETPLPTSPPERNVYIDSSSSVSSPASSRSKKEAKLSSPVSHRSTSPFIDQENDLALSSNSDNPTYVASPQQHTPTIGQSSALSSSPNSSALASSPHLESSTHD